MANYAQTSKNFTGQFMTGLAGVNTGLIIPWGSSSVPSGFLECNGQAVSRSTYADLFAVVSTTYGVGDGTTTFNVPDLTDKTVVNKSNTKNLAQTGGANTVTSQGNISGNLANYTLTTAEIAAHTHGNFAKDMFFSGCYPAIGGAPGSFYGGPSSNTGGGGAHTHSLSSPAFSGDATSVLQPFLVLIYIIKT
jgi:microcystin-dependent protein